VDLKLKVAIMTDVHGNAPALRAVLNDIDSQPGIEHTYCLGDMIAIGPDTNQVLDILFSRQDISMILGNHEDAVLAVLAGREPGSPGTERVHHFWVAKCIEPRFASALRQLPRKLVREHGDQRLLLLHYHENDGRLQAVDREPSVERLEAMYCNSGAQAVCFGHHHPRHFFRSPARVYVNPGSLGCYHLPLARYAVLHCGSGRVTVEMKEIPYENRDFLASYERLHVPAADFIIRTFHGNQRPASR